jgi:hypothetical protein
MKKPKTLIPETAKAAAPKPPQGSAEQAVMQAQAALRQAGNVIDLLYGELVARQSYINSLPKPEAAKA